MKTETITKTLVCQLETSERKNNRVRSVIDEWQRIAERMAELMPSFGPKHWRSQDSTIFRTVNKEFPDTDLRSHDANQAGYKVGEAFGSWHSNNHRQARPQFGDGSYARFCHCGINITENDRGYGVKIGLEPYNPEWFHIKAGQYQLEHLEEIVNGDLKTGSGELHLDGDSLWLNLSVSREVEVYEPVDVDTTVGVDLGERALYSAVVKDDDGVNEVAVESGREFRHYRERLKRKRSQLMEKGDRRGVLKCADEHERYTDYMTHKASREIVDLAVEHEPAAIVLEDLSHYRTRDDAIHDWPFAESQTKICYKATEAGIPVTFIDPHGTSYTCSNCGSEVQENRNGVEFHCRRCDYEVHADVNAAKNIASRGVEV